jgi:molecular chaperone HtpG
MSSEIGEKETRGFQAEVKQLMHLMVHSLYSNKEIFLRELISNASDAADRLRFEALANSDLYESDPELKIWIDIDKEERLLIVRDNGIGMTREEMISHLGTIAKSGTKEFINTLSGDRAKDSKLIGQFGVGFYSAFIVAERVEVISRKAGHGPATATRWVSTGQGEYEIDGAYKSTRGTEVRVYLKEAEQEFTNAWHVRHIVTKYSDHITLPVVMQKEKDTSKEAKKEDADVIDVPGEEVVNRATALWTLLKTEISDEQYNELYKHVAHDFEDALIWGHNKVEGKLEYISLLFIPKRAPFDLWHTAKPRGLKLYVQRVFIMDDAEQFLPHYLRFVRGIIDSNDLPLNVSREILQNNKVIDSIRSAIVKRVLSLLEDLANNEPEKYQIFWKEFGQVLKEGPAEDFANKEQIAKLLRFSTTATDKEQQTVSLDEYISRMRAGQERIYYITADSFKAAKHSPHLEIFRKNQVEVLLLSERIDEWLVGHLSEFSGKKLQSVARGKLELEQLGEIEKPVEQNNNEQLQVVLSKMKELLKEEVKEVRLTGRLTNSPACVVTDENDITPQMERLMRAAGQQVPKIKPILELNPQHPLVVHLEHVQQDEQFADLSHVILAQALLAVGGTLADPADFAIRLNKILLSGFTG